MGRNVLHTSTKMENKGIGFLAARENIRKKMIFEVALTLQPRQQQEQDRWAWQAQAPQ